MNNFIFKSANRLTKNSSISVEDRLREIEYKLQFVQAEQRHARSDLKDINGKLDRLLVDKHLQMQVDEYFKDNTEPDSGDLD